MRSQIIAFIIFLGSVNLMAQGEFSLYNLNKTVPQAHQLNPAFNSNHKVVIGLPVIASTHLSLNTDQLSFNNMFSSQANGNYKLNYDKIAESLNGKNSFSINSDIQLFFLALNLKRNHFTLAVNERISSMFSYSDDIVNLALFGNGDKSVLGKKIDLSEMALNQIAYHELALGYARDINDKLYDNLPVLIVNKYDDLTEQVLLDNYEKMKHKLFNLQKFGYNFWENIIS